VSARKEKTYKKVKRPGYKLTVIQEMTFEDGEKERYTIHEESLTKDQINKAFDVFQREILYFLLA